MQTGEESWFHIHYSMRPIHNKQFHSDPPIQNTAPYCHSFPRPPLSVTRSIQTGKELLIEDAVEIAFVGANLDGDPTRIASSVRCA